MSTEPVIHEPQLRWWTHGEYLPQQVELLVFVGERRWLARFVGEEEDVTDIAVRDIYDTEADALHADLEWLESVLYFVRDLEYENESDVLQILSQLIAITRSKLEKGR